MTTKQNYAHRGGVDMNIPVTNIQFVDPDGNVDETQFDTHDEHELAELWWQFCKENNFITLIKGEADWETGSLVSVNIDEILG